MKIGALEAGGTKMVCAIGDEKGSILEKISFPTQTPDITIPQLINFFQQYDICALGIGCFGPLDLHQNSPSYGWITSTPKHAWQNYDIVGTFKKALGLPVGFDTDVNGSALGEATWGASKGLDHSLYITIGTGIGVGVISNGQLLHGMLHPEAGHLLLRQHPSDSYTGKCPYHGTCFEGLASGPAIEARWGKKAADLSEEQSVWELEAYYIGQALVNYILMLSPQRIILGGGVMHQEQLMPLIHQQVLHQLNGYLDTPALQNIATYIVRPQLGDNQGIMGALQLGLNAYYSN